MSADPKSQLAELLAAAVLKAYPQAGEVAVELDRPKNADHGDFAANVALQLAKRVGAKPREVAEKIVAALAGSALIERAEVAGPGFINLTMTKGERFAVVPQILAGASRFGRASAHQGHKIMVEFVSANPTGPLHVGTAAAARAPFRRRSSGRAGASRASSTTTTGQPDRQPGAVGAGTHQAGARRAWRCPRTATRRLHPRDRAREYAARISATSQVTTSPNPKFAVDSEGAAWTCRRSA